MGSKFAKNSLHHEIFPEMIQKFLWGAVPVDMTSWVIVQCGCIKLGFTIDNYSIDAPINFYLNQYIFEDNTRIYNLISVTQIARLLLRDAIISSKADPHIGSKKGKRSYGKAKNNKTVLKTLPFIRIPYLKQQSSILRCFSRLKFEKVYLAMRFSVLYFAVRW